MFLAFIGGGRGGGGLTTFKDWMVFVKASLITLEIYIFIDFSTLSTYWHKNIDTFDVLVSLN